LEGEGAAPAHFLQGSGQLKEIGPDVVWLVRKSGPQGRKKYGREAAPSAVVDVSQLQEQKRGGGGGAARARRDPRLPRPHPPPPWPPPPPPSPTEGVDSTKSSLEVLRREWVGRVLSE
jgi:hypothetical protein